MVFERETVLFREDTEWKDGSSKASASGRNKYINDHIIPERSQNAEEIYR